ncbi:hypothetical protein B0T16DRAFT_488681 [Cercophora newfieldiana]|uniref:Uncharacterized protein n=1 Tax=Cercophora newfieldiana TaxID=92897 RepID=A0AA39YRZ1_9PEZI|nr:hypothetical protein B0T16DRAFT_488681 [Cercophora newfieldiana]
MSSPSIPSADKISAEEFAEYLERYPSCVEAISASKSTKPGQKTLSELDQYRYVEAIDRFTPQNSDPMTLDEVQLLVEWKLRHGTFRPTLMKLVTSNDPSTVQSTIAKAITTYRSSSDISAALTILTKLKGIGPATASLLLAVHDADKVIFFADEAFYWLCLGGVKGAIKYNAKEYAALNEKARGLRKRLGVKAVDIERVAYVLMKEGTGSGGAAKSGGEKVKAEKKVPVKVEKKAPVKGSEEKKVRDEVKGSTKVESKAAVKGQAKRKAADESSDGKGKALPARRSKRGKQS